mgnify:FL=1
MIIMKLTIFIWMIVIVYCWRIFWLFSKDEKMGLRRDFDYYVAKNKITSAAFAATALTVVSAVWLWIRG